MSNTAVVTSVILIAACAATLTADGDEVQGTLATRIRKLSQIRSVDGLSAADLGLTFVQPQRDKDTGFMVAGSNDTKSILSLKSINGVEIDALEKQMRPGAPGEAGS